MVQIAGLRCEEVDVLRTARVIRGFDVSTFGELLRSCRHQEYGAGESVLTLADGVDTLGVVVTGQVSLSLISQEGRELLLEERGPGGIFLLADAPSDSMAALICTATLDGTIVYLFETDRVVALCPANSQSTVDLVRLLREQVTVQQELLGEQTFCSIRQNLALKLARSASRSDVPLSYTREEVAHLVGTTREPATRALGELRDEGLIMYEPRGQEIVVLDHVRLERRAPS